MLYVKSTKNFEFIFKFEHHFAYKTSHFLYNFMKLFWICFGLKVSCVTKYAKLTQLFTSPHV
jgi:hypothetical protein